MSVILLIPDSIDLDTELLPTGEWMATDRNTYEAEWEPDRGWFSKSPVGYGSTEQEAIEDLLGRMED